MSAHTWQRHELEVLARALEMADVADAMTARIASDGLMVGDGRPHPLLAARRDALLASARFWRQLRFTDPAHPAPRPGRPSGPNWSAVRKAGHEAQQKAMLRHA